MSLKLHSRYLPVLIPCMLYLVSGMSFNTTDIYGDSNKVYFSQNEGEIYSNEVNNPVTSDAYVTEYAVNAIAYAYAINVEAMAEMYTQTTLAAVTVVVDTDLAHYKENLPENQTLESYKIWDLDNF